jgi:hypothetical protein
MIKNFTHMILKNTALWHNQESCEKYIYVKKLSIQI